MWIFEQVEVIQIPTLGIPYFRPGETKSHDYVNLRERPDLIEFLPELKECQPLKEFVLAVNSPSSIFQTYGCEKWRSDWLHDQFPDFRIRSGSYTDIALVDISLCSTQAVSRAIIDGYRRIADSYISHPGVQAGFTYG